MQFLTKKLSQLNLALPAVIWLDFFYLKARITKWWKLRGKAAQAFKERMLGEGPWEEGEDADDMWLKMQHVFGKWPQRCLA